MAESNFHQKTSSTLGMIDKLLGKLQTDIQRGPAFLLSIFSSSIFFTLLLALPLINIVLRLKPGVFNFSDHIISAANAANIDVSLRIILYLLFLFGFLLLLLVIFVFLYIKFNNHFLQGINKRAIEFIRDTSLIGIAVIIASIFTSVNDFASYFIGIAVLLGWIFISQKDDRKDFDFLIWSLLISVPFALFISQFTYLFGFLAKLDITARLANYLFALQPSQFTMLAVFTCSFGFISIILFVILPKALNHTLISKIERFDSYQTALIISGIPFLFTGIVQSLLLEFLNIINKNFAVVFSHPHLMYIIVILAASAISFLLFMVIKSRKIVSSSAGNLIYKLYMPVILLTFTLIYIQPSRMIAAGNEFFEKANHGLAIDALFRYGSIPQIQNFDAHMLMQQIWAYFYSVLNGYQPWAAFLYNNGSWLLYFIPMFYIFRKLIGPTNSFFMILCFPLLTNLITPLYLMSGLVAICIIRMISSRKTTDYYLFWITGLLLFMYRADLGLSALLGGISAYFISCFVLKEKIYITKLFLPGGIVFGLLLVLFTLLCMFRGINPIDRLIEIVHIFQGSLGGAYTSVGNYTQLAYILGYYVLPLFALISAFWVVLKNALLNRAQDNAIAESNVRLINREAFIVLIFFTAFFIFNAERGIVRHSFMEGTIWSILGTIPLSLLSLSVIAKKPNLNMYRFLATALAIIIVINVNVSSYKGLGSSLLSNAITSPSYLEQYSAAYAFNGTRITGSVMPQDAEILKSVLDTVLTAQETYFDFASVNYFYALVGRKNPVYVNQPLNLLTDTLQKDALQEIKNTNPPVALMPILGNPWSYWDGITIDYKYYMIAEYLYENYVPLIRLPMFDIYCLKDVKGLYTSELTKSGLIAPPLYSGTFDYIDGNSLSYHNATSQIFGNGSLALLPSGPDPYIFGFMGQLRKKYPAINSGIGVSKPTQITLLYSSTTPGSIQLFYTLNEDEGFSEQQSMVFTINATGDGINTAVLALPSLPYELRIDVDTQEIALEHITISHGLQTINNQPETWVRHLGAIPMLWAEKDGSKAFISPPLLQHPVNDITEFTASLTGIPSNEPMYLFLQLDSAADGTATVETSQDSKRTLGEYDFTVLKGSHSYVILLSTDYHWWNNEVNIVNIVISQPVNINKFCFIPVNSSVYYNYSAPQ